jgi:dienelactone hydrolase
MTRAIGALVFAAFLTAPALAQRPSADFQSLGRAAIEELAARSFETFIDRLDPKAGAVLTRDKLAALWTSIITQAGGFKSIMSVEARDEQGAHVAAVAAAFENQNLTFRVVFNDDGKIAGFFLAPADAPPAIAWRAPPYVDPLAFSARDVTVGPVKLPGTLTIPKGTSLVPAVVLVHGSGPHDRDETIGPNKPFRDLAEGLASRNVAVLRYDKRSLVTPVGIHTVNEEVVDDAKAAVEFLTTEPRIDRRRIIVIGHSLGGTLAPRIAAADSRTAAIVIMAGAARPFEDLLVEQLRYLTGPTSQETALAEEAARKMRDPQLAPNMVVDVLGSPLPGSYILDLRNYHPAEVAASLKIPIAVLRGQRDYQVTPTDFELWKKALEGHPNVMLKLYATLNHFFLPGTGLSKPEEYMLPGHVDEQVITDLVSWIETVR